MSQKQLERLKDNIVSVAIQWQEKGAMEPKYYTEKLFKNVMLYKEYLEEVQESTKPSLREQCKIVKGGKDG